MPRPQCASNLTGVTRLIAIICILASPPRTNLNGTGFDPIDNRSGNNKTNDQGDIPMKAIVVTDQAAGTAGMKLVERPEPQAAINDVVIQVHASGFVPTELA